LSRDLTQATRRLAIKRFLLLGLVLGIGLAAACYGYRWWTVGRFIESTDDAYVGGEVTVIAPKVSGLIAEVAVTDNQAVQPGDLLVKLDGRDYRAALAKTAGAFGEPAVDRRQYLARLDALALIKPQSGKAGCGTKLERLGVLATRDRQRPL
jgi:multidrug resistance efflux pump